MAKPTDDIVWATDGGAEIAEPSGGQKATGWQSSTRPPAHWFNWWQRAVYRWITWFEDVLNTDGGTITVVADTGFPGRAITADGRGVGNAGGIAVLVNNTGIGVTVNSSGSADAIQVNNPSSATGHSLSISGNNTKSPLRIAPTNQPSGPNAVGDMYMTVTGALRICTVAGTPGTWSTCTVTTP